MTLAELQELHARPLFDLLARSREIHTRHWPGDRVQLCALLSIKTGGCAEDCSYCAQSAHHDTGVERKPLMGKDDVLPIARRARALGATRFCMGAAWPGVRLGDGRFERVLEIVRDVRALGLEVCVTLGHLSAREASLLRAAGVTAYNHNIDTGPEFYPQIVSTHSFADRLETIAAIQSAGIALCCGGILGMGESTGDRLQMLSILSGFDPPPESVPINCLTPIPGTPLADRPPIDVLELARFIATARIAIPTAKIRLSAGRSALSREGQALCFFAGANSIFYGERLLTTDNPGPDTDLQLLESLDLKPLAPFDDPRVRQLAGP